MTWSKAKAQTKHAQTRALERIGVTLNKNDLAALANRIKAGKCKFLYRQSTRVTVFRTTVGDKEMDVVYDKQRHLIVTFMYPMEEAFYEKKRQEYGENQASQENDKHLSPLAPNTILDW